MSIDWLHDLEREIDNGKDIYACPAVQRNQWIIGKPLEELKKLAKRTADHKKMAVNIVRLIAKQDAIAGDLFLVPTNIGEEGARGEPQVQWSTVETKDAAEMMRDVRHGPSPFFGMQVVETIEFEGTI
ncbi:MAG: hypothetical protein J5J00_03740 [Deltaproteobacteria bacterium]|nr:hypothetical protein [Deltaproteobacteria bacterium]